MASAEQVRIVCEKTGCGLMDARIALDKREGDLACAIEYVERTGLAAVMPDSRRYPLWSKRKAATEELDRLKYLAEE